MFNSWKESKGSELSFGQKSICSIVAGFIGSIIGTPPDLILIRMQSDNSLPEAERRNYKGVTDVIYLNPGF
jgi:solute carrier family 25 oxoglutarate transporter 11